MTTLRRFLADEHGATAIEYALIASLIFLAIVAAVSNFANKTTSMFDDIAAHVK